MVINRFVQWPLDELIEEIVLADWEVPVRPLEALLAHGGEAVEPLLEELKKYTPDELQRTRALWPAVALGELRDARAAEPLASLVRSADVDEVLLSIAAAEALAKIGVAALPALQTLLDSETQHTRLWAYYAAGRISDDTAFSLLLTALERDAELTDVIAMTLGGVGRPEASDPILAALARAEPWQRPEIEQALVDLHGTEADRPESSRDWRLRYRWNPGVGWFPVNWITISAIVRGDADLMKHRSIPAARSLEEILAEARSTEPELCDCCGVPPHHLTGVPVCPDTAAWVAEMQARLLGIAAEENSFEDLFDVLHHVELKLAEVDEKPKRSGSAAAAKGEGLRTSLQVLREACIWLVEQGIESVGAGRVRLHREARGAAERYGRLLPPPPAAPVSAQAARVGRNDPCPCGSGRKFKKCCGTAN
jgi:HEAT repeat protein